MKKLMSKIAKDRFLVFILVTSVIALIFSVVSLRSNNLTMIELRESVYRADKNNGDVELALRELRSFIYAHMNTNPSSGGNAIKPPIQLKYRYERLVAAEKQRIAEANTRVYTEAQAYCEQQNPGGVSGRTRVPCIEEYVSQNGVTEKPVADSLYKFDFVSPRFSFDLAGILLLVTASGFFVGLARITQLLVVKRAK